MSSVPELFQTDNLDSQELYVSSEVVEGDVIMGDGESQTLFLGPTEQAPATPHIQNLQKFTGQFGPLQKVEQTPRS